MLVSADEAEALARSAAGGLLVVTPAGESLGMARLVGVEPCPVPEGQGGFVVTTRVSRVVDELLAITLSCALDPILATREHRFYSETRRAWVPAGELQPGERLRSRWGPCWVTSIEVRREATRVCDLAVAGVHAFYVGDAGIVVHNGKKACTPTKLRNLAENRGKGIPDSRLGPSGEPYRHGARSPSRKRAIDRAQEAGHGHKPMIHRDHAHPTDPWGIKVKGPHYYWSRIALPPDLTFPDNPVPQEMSWNDPVSVTMPTGNTGCRR